MSNNNEHWSKNPIWQFIGVLISPILAIAGIAKQWNYVYIVAGYIVIGITVLLIRSSARRSNKAYSSDSKTSNGVVQGIQKVEKEDVNFNKNPHSRDYKNIIDTVKEIEDVKSKILLRKNIISKYNLMSEKEITSLKFFMVIFIASVVMIFTGVGIVIGGPLFLFSILYIGFRGIFSPKPNFEEFSTAKSEIDIMEKLLAELEKNLESLKRIV